ncbi:UNVERIFIED_CONTAM: hypothetical protein FKN15_041433 [Acipenser sinensis]
MQNTRPMSGKSGFHPCSACNANIPQEDKHTLYVRCLGVQHATLALEMEAACDICEAFHPWGSSGGWEEASQPAQEDTLSIAASGQEASFSSDMQVGETPAEEEPGFEGVCLLLTWTAHCVRPRSSEPVATELRLLSSTLLQLSGLQGQALGRILTSLIMARRQLWLSQARVPDADNAAVLDTPISQGHTFGPAVEEILQKSRREREASRQVAALLPPRASTWGRSSCWRASQGLAYSAHQQQATGPNRQGTQVVASPHTSITGGVFRASTLNGHPKLPRLSLDSPSRAPEGWWPQTPFSAQQLQYWHACTSDSWVLATVLQFRLGLPPFQGITSTFVTDPLQASVLQKEVAALLCGNLLVMLRLSSNAKAKHRST